MENCFKKQLNATLVDDGSMRKENELRFDVNHVENPTYTWNTGTQYLNAQANTGNVAYCVGANGSFVNNYGQETGTVYPASGEVANIEVYAKNAGGWQVGLKNKYDLIKIKTGIAFSLNIEEIEYCTSLNNLSCLNAYGDLFFLRNLPLATLLEVQGGGLFGDIKYIPSTSTQLYISSNPNIVGDISSLGKCVALSTLRVNFCIGVYGSLEGLATAQVANGRTSGTLEPQIIGSKVTYQGATISTHKTIRFGTSMVNPTTEETSQGWQIA